MIFYRVIKKKKMKKPHLFVSMPKQTRGVIPYYGYLGFIFLRNFNQYNTTYILSYTQRKVKVKLLFCVKYINNYI